MPAKSLSPTGPDPGDTGPHSGGTYVIRPKGPGSLD